MIGPYSRDFEEVEVFNCSWVEMEGFFFFYYYYYFVFLEPPYLWHMDIPKLGVESRL